MNYKEVGLGMETQSTDMRGRVRLPKGFANTRVIIEQVSDTEIRIRKAVAVPEDEARFCEESSTPLSDRDRDRFLQLLASAGGANDRLRLAIKKHTKPHG
jgi:hypothetical protein